MSACIVRSSVNVYFNNVSKLICHRSSFQSLSSSSRLFSSSVINYARKYSEKHEWVDTEGKIGTVGITNYAQEALGDIVYAQLPDIGVEYSQADECGALESVKAASELFTPLSGTVTEVNMTLEGKPSLINEDCYKEGWLFKLELSKPEELNDLMDEAGYEKFLSSAQ